MTTARYLSLGLFGYVVILSQDRFWSVNLHLFGRSITITRGDYVK